MRVRSLDALHDWNFGKGKNDYKRDQDAVAQNIDTRLLSFFGDCFFNVSAGIDWWNLLGAKNQLSINLAVSRMILNTAYVTGIVQLSIELNVRTRNLHIVYEVETSFGRTASEAILSTL